jgi:hypothetical protein
MVSNDGTTWIECRPAQNPAWVALSTGTASATGDISIDAPMAVYGWRFARCSIFVGVTTGGSSDLYAISYSYRQLGAGDA